MTYGFTFLPSYYEAVRPLPNDQRLLMYDAILDYAIDGKMPQNLPPILNGYFTLLRPNIDSSIKHYSNSVENGKKGGRPPRKEPNKNPEKTQHKPSGNRDKDKEKEKDKDKECDKDMECENKGADKPRTRTHFSPPTVEQVAEYVKQRGSRVDPQGFIDFYASKGWMIGKTPMKDWKAACRNAENWDRWAKQQKKDIVKEASEYGNSEYDLF